MIFQQIHAEVFFITLHFYFFNLKNKLIQLDEQIY